MQVGKAKPGKQDKNGCGGDLGYEFLAKRDADQVIFQSDEKDDHTARNGKLKLGEGTDLDQQGDGKDDAQKNGNAGQAGGGVQMYGAAVWIVVDLPGVGHTRKRPDTVKGEEH